MRRQGPGKTLLLADYDDSTLRAAAQALEATGYRVSTQHVDVSDRISAVDLLGVALVLEEFGSVIAPGGAGLVISSMAGHMPPAFPAEMDQALACRISSRSSMRARRAGEAWRRAG